MSRGNKWVALDKNLSQEFKCIKREFSMIEAMYSYSLDQDNGSTGTISGYSKLWGWSRNKVRRFIKGIRTDEGHFKDSKRTLQGHPIHFIDNALMNKKDTSRTDEGHLKDTCHDTTIDPNPKPDPKPKKKKKPFSPPTHEDVINYFLENGYKREAAIKAFNYYNIASWKDSKGNQVKNWKQKMIAVWFKDENKDKQTIYKQPPLEEIFNQ